MDMIDPASPKVSSSVPGVVSRGWYESLEDFLPLPLFAATGAIAGWAVADGLSWLAAGVVFVSQVAIWLLLFFRHVVRTKQWPREVPKSAAAVLLLLSVMMSLATSGTHLVTAYRLGPGPIGTKVAIHTAEGVGMWLLTFGGRQALAAVWQRFRKASPRH
jgi:hypothetical protein